MTRAIAIFVCLTASIALAEDVRRPLTNEDVIRLVRAGFAEPLIRQAVEINPSQFDVSRAGVASLRSAGVPEAVLTAMSRDRSRPEHLRLLDAGIYVKRGDAYTLVEADPSSGGGFCGNGRGYHAREPGGNG